MMRESDSPEHHGRDDHGRDDHGRDDHGRDDHGRDDSAYQTRHHPEALQEKPPVARPFEPATSDERRHGASSPEENQSPVRVSSASPPTSTEDEKEGDLEAGQADFGQPPVTHETPTEPVDSNVVDWDGPQDPSNPVNWSMGLKWGNVAVVSAVTFITYVQ